GGGGGGGAGGGRGDGGRGRGRGAAGRHHLLVRAARRRGARGARLEARALLSHATPWRALRRPRPGDGRRALVLARRSGARGHVRERAHAHAPSPHAAREGVTRRRPWSEEPARGVDLTSERGEDAPARPVGDRVAAAAARTLRGGGD